MTTIYLDMDGVVADFNSYAKKKLNIDRIPHTHSDENWNKLSSNLRLFRDLEKTPEADRLVKFCQLVCKEKNWTLLFLTAVPKDDDVPWAYYDKIIWAQKYYPDIPVMFGPKASDKWRHCQPGDILIDDRPSNCEEWKLAKGYAILHLGNLSETLRNLSKLL